MLVLNDALRTRYVNRHLHRSDKKIVVSISKVIGDYLMIYKHLFFSEYITEYL